MNSYSQPWEGASVATPPVKGQRRGRWRCEDWGGLCGGQWGNHWHTQTHTKCCVFRLSALMPLLLLTDSEGHGGRTVATTNGDERRWHHSGHQGDERSESRVTPLAQNRRWVTPVSSQQRPIWETPVEMCINRWTASQRATYSCTNQVYLK